MKKQERLLSLDALRGFDMFFIIGGAALIESFFGLFPSSFSDFIIGQMYHVDWHGFTFYDMIFPLFLFIAGVSFPFSLANSRSKGASEKKVIMTIVKRGIKLVLLGFIFNGILKLDFDNMRYVSVLGRIGVAWMIAALIYMHVNVKWSVLISVVILLGYTLINVLLINPEAPPGTSPLAIEGSFVAWFDMNYLPGKTLFSTHDPLGILSTFPAIVTAVLGMLTGSYLKNSKHNEHRKVLLMFVTSILLIATGLLWNLLFPINKMLWSSSYVVFAGGLSLLLLTLFYYVIDVLKIRRWSFIFTVIGLNSITVYMAQKIINFKQISVFLGGGTVKLFSDNYQALVASIIYLIVIWLFLYFLYRNKIFLKV